MTHADLKKNLADYLEGDLGLEKRAVLDAHLDGCEVCSREVAELQQTIRLLRMLPEPEAPPMIAANVMRRIRAGENKPGYLTRIAQGFKAIFEPSFVLPASAIAAAALVVVALQDPSVLKAPGVFDRPESARIEQAMAQGGSAGPLPSQTAGLETVIPRPASSSPLSSNRRPAGWVQGGLAGGIAPNRLLNQAATPTEHGVSPSPRRTFYADPMIVSRLSYSDVPDVVVSNGGANPLRVAPSPSYVVDRVGADPRDPGRARAVSQSQALEVARNRSASEVRVSSSMSLADAVRSGMTSSGADPRDAWLARGLTDPVGFARFISEQNLAEQELWVSRLSERAEARGLLADLTDSMRRSGDAAANWLASDFEAEVARRREGAEAAAQPTVR